MDNYLNLYFELGDSLPKGLEDLLSSKLPPEPFDVKVKRILNDSK